MSDHFESLCIKGLTFFIGLQLFQLSFPRNMRKTNIKIHYQKRQRKRHCNQLKCVSKLGALKTIVINFTRALKNCFVRSIKILGIRHNVLRWIFICKLSNTKCFLGIKVPIFQSRANNFDHFGHHFSNVMISTNTCFHNVAP